MKKAPIVRLLSRLFASPCLLAILASLPAQAETRIQHTPENSTTTVTDIVGRVYDTERLKAKEAQPLDKYFIGGMNLGAISKNVLHGWNVGLKTGWAPADYAHGNFQTAYTDTPSEVSAMQAQYFNFGGYLRHNEVPAGSSLPNIRYTYRFSSPIYPFTYGTTGRNGDTTKVVINFYAAVPVDNFFPKGNNAPHGSGGCGGSLNFIDRSTVPWKVLIVGFGFYDRRGYNIPGGHYEEVARVAGQFMVKCLFEDGTKYSTLMQISGLYPNTPASQKSQTVPWNTLKRFAISISRKQFSAAIEDLNAYIKDLNATSGSSYALYSTNPDSYTISALNVGIEANLYAGVNKPLYEYNMSFRGSHMTFSTIY